MLVNTDIYSKMHKLMFLTIFIQAKTPSSKILNPKLQCTHKTSKQTKILKSYQTPEFG